MKALLALASSLALSALLLTAQAQAPATSHDNPTPARSPKTDKKAEMGSKALGRKMVQKSKPTDMRVPLPRKVN